MSPEATFSQAPEVQFLLGWTELESGTWFGHTWAQLAGGGGGGEYDILPQGLRALGFPNASAAYCAFISFEYIYIYNIT